jgi:hypothetical protein
MPYYQPDFDAFLLEIHTARDVGILSGSCKAARKLLCKLGIETLLFLSFWPQPAPVCWRRSAVLNVPHLRCSGTPAILLMEMCVLPALHPSVFQLHVGVHQVSSLHTNHRSIYALKIHWIWWSTVHVIWGAGFLNLNLVDGGPFSRGTLKYVYSIFKTYSAKSSP